MNNFNVNGDKNQVNFAAGNGVLHAVQNNGLDMQEKGNKKSGDTVVSIFGDAKKSGGNMDSNNTSPQKKSGIVQRILNTFLSLFKKTKDRIHGGRESRTDYAAPRAVPLCGIPP